MNPRTVGAALLSLVGLTSLAWGEERARDLTPYQKMKGWLFHEAQPDSLRVEYEDLFGQPYPRKKPYPLSRFQPFEDVERFNDAFDRTSSGVQSRIDREEGHVTLSVRVPDSSGRPLNVDVQRERVLVSLQNAETLGPYRLRKGVDQYFDIPKGADAKTAKVTREGDVVRIQFERKG